MIPAKIDIAAAPPEAMVFIYLKVYTSQDGKAVLPWKAPTVDVVKVKIGSLQSREVAFAFNKLPAGTYGVSVLIDTGRPHVPPGSVNFTAYPGDYAGGTQDALHLTDDQSMAVSIDGGMYVTIPEGYQAPLYGPE